jgi:hypothetical protein
MIPEAGHDRPGRRRGHSAAAAAILAPDLGLGLPAEVEAALHDRQAGGQRPGQYEPLALASLGIGAASLIVSIAQLAWSILTDHRAHTAQPSPEAIARQIRITLRQRDIPITAGTDGITDVVITEVTRLPGPPPADRHTQP